MANTIFHLCEDNPNHAIGQSLCVSKEVKVNSPSCAAGTHLQAELQIWMKEEAAGVGSLI